MNLVLTAYAMTRYSGGTREDLTNIHAFQCSQKSFYLFMHRALPRSVFFPQVQELSYLEEEGRGPTLSALMTLKSWSREDVTLDDEID